MESVTGRDLITSESSDDLREAVDFRRSLARAEIVSRRSQYSR